MADTRTTRALNTATLIAQLRALAQLTQTEAQIARIRVAQARTDAVRLELRRNGDDAVRRARRITEQLSSLDAVPDVVTPAIGRILALVKSTVEQAQPLDEALLGDLTLEHQLLDRARYVRVPAGHAGHSPDDLNAVIAFEESHKNRSGDVSAAQTRFTDVAKDAAGVT